MVNLKTIFLNCRAFLIPAVEPRVDGVVDIVPLAAVLPVVLGVLLVVIGGAKWVLGKSW